MSLCKAEWNRRRVLKTGAAFGITLSMRPLALHGAESREPIPAAPGWAGKAAGQPRQRIDGVAKVTGQKLYARDFRAADMPGWPDETSHALLVMASSATHVFTGLNLSQLDKNLKPDRVVTAEDLAEQRIIASGFFASDLFCSKNSTPAFLGQPVALLIYHDFARFVAARQIATANADLASYGDETPATTGGPYGANRFTRVAGNSRRGPDIFSPVKNGWVGPVRYQKANVPVWPPSASNGTAAEQASFQGEAIRADLRDGKAGRVFNQTFETQSTDPVFLEPESGLAWHDTDGNRLSLVLGVQSPEITLESLGGMLKDASAPFKVGEIDASFASLGGGFGGKDHTILPLYAAIAGLFANGRPVRLALDRFQQFQLGIKRHSTKIENQLGIDPETGVFSAYACDLSLDGGGLANFSASVADVSATAASSIYYVPRSDITTVAHHSRGVTAGSMRGYGTLQSMTAMECLVDEIASDLGKDPIALRRVNALKTDELNLTGNAVSGAVRTMEVLDALENHPLWTERTDRKKAYEATNPGRVYGTGVACVTKDFGAGGDGVLAAVSITEEGKITVWSNSIEMGTGISTAVAQRVAPYLGRAADFAHMDAPDVWVPLGLKTSDTPWTITQQQQDEASRNPQWVPTISSPASASIGAHVNTHAVAEAAEIIFRFGLWPAAQAIWNEGTVGGQVASEPITFEELRWIDGALAGGGMEPLPIAQVSGKAHQMGLVTGAMVHAFNRWSWARAAFTVDGSNYESAIDALAVRRGTPDWARIDRTEITYPPASFERIGVGYSSCCGAVVGLSVDITNGQVAVEAVHEVLECGRPIVDALVSGIAQGGIAMGIGQALHEYLPLYEEGPGNGTWNLNRYHVPYAADVPVWDTTLEVLPPLSETDPPKGMAEVVMIPVVPAVVNAIHDATGKRFYRLPVTAEDIMKVQ